jgi:RNA polymerase sigma-70 factor (ECF subfamily)
VNDDPADAAAEEERRRHMQHAFAQLSPEHQAVLTLRVVEDLAYEEIARALNIPVGTVMSRLSRARAELKSRLAARIGDEP